MEDICIRIEWDSGSHNIQNKDNYSYEILDPYLEGCKRYDVWANYEVIFLNPFIPRNPCSAEWYRLRERRKLVDGSHFQRFNINRGFNPSARLIPGSSFSACSGPNAKSARFLVRDYNSQCSSVFTEEFQEYVSGADSVNLVDPGIEYIEVATGQPPPIKLKIIDGGVESIYSIINRNSVQVVEYECGCPPNQLDCGDCCLDCNSIFNQISSIRTLVRRLN